MKETLYAIGDIHGQYELLLDALTLIELDGGAQARVIILGDLVDRGAESRAVIETLMAGQAEGRNWTVLMGNHDRLFIDFLKFGRTTHPKLRPGLSWLDERMGGSATLASYGVALQDDVAALHSEARRYVPEAHLAFLEGLPLSYQTDDLFFVHAGVQPQLPLEWQSEDDMLWIRDAFLNYEEPMPRLIVHGHTSVEAAEHRGNRVNLDSGAGWGRELSVGVFEKGFVYLLEEDGRRPLLPS